MLRHLREWYQGKDIRVDPNEPDTIGGMRVLHDTYKEFHWTAKAARSLVCFYLRHWIALWTLGASFLGIYVAYLAVRCL